MLDLDRMNGSERVRVVWTTLLCWACLLLSACSNAPRTSESTSSVQSALSAEQKRFTIVLPESVSLSQFTASANQGVLLHDRSQVQTISGGWGVVTNAGGGSTRMDHDVRSGDVVSIGSVTMLDRSRINGNLTTSGTLTLGSSTAITGTTQEHTAIDTVAYSWTVQFPTTTTDVILQPNATRQLSPGGFARVVVNRNARLSISAGTYYFDTLDLEPQGTLAVNTTAGPVFIYVRQTLIYRGNQALTGPANRILLGYAGNQSVAIESPLNSTLVAPSAAIRLATGGTQHKGALYAQSVEIDPDVTFKGAAFSAWTQLSFQLAPTFECVEARPDGSKVAVFGYFNPGTQTVTVPVGNNNKFVPNPTNRQQPTTFAPGAGKHIFAVGFTGTPPKWTLNGMDAVVDVTKLCLSSFDLTAIADTTVNQASPYANFGADTQLQTSAGASSLVTFDRSTLIARRGIGRLVRSAELHVPLSSGSPAIDSYPMRKVWSESAATWACASDQDATPVGNRCQNNQVWSLALRDGTWDNPYDTSAVASGAAVGAEVVFNVTEDVQRFVGGDYATAPVGWILQSRTGDAAVLGSREGAQPARLVIGTIAFSDADLAGAAPFSFAVDTSLATTDQLPAFADGQPRQLGVLKSSDGDVARFVQNELLVVTDSPTVLADFVTRWNATELAHPTTAVPGLPAGHIFRIDTTRANPASLVSNLRAIVNRPDGLQKVSSDTALRVLSAASEEFARGTIVGINWVGEGGSVNLDGFSTQTFTDGAPGTDDALTFETSSNLFDWDYLGPGMHDVLNAWAYMFFSGKLSSRPIDAAIIDSGFSNTYQDEASFTQLVCASGSCENPFNCGGGDPCPWHGVHVAAAGYGEPNNEYGGVGPGAEVADLTLDWGFGDMGTLLIEIPALVLGGEDIISLSNAIPVPDYLSWTTVPAESNLAAARALSGRLIFAMAGNSNTNVDKKRCYWIPLVGDVCPWEEKVWFPCESWGVNCIGGTQYATKGRAGNSNYGPSVRYYASYYVPAGSDPFTDVGSQFQFMRGTSFSTPFIAGTAALTWAADTSMSAGDVESCLSRARDGGPDGRFVNTRDSAVCGLGFPSNLPPLVRITSPSTQDSLLGRTATFGSLAPIVLIAEAQDYEDGVIGDISWSADGSGFATGTNVVYSPHPGVTTITATAHDSNGATGTYTIFLSIAPAPPAVSIIKPDADVIAGLPTDLVGAVTNLTALGASQPCDTANWVGFEGDSILFDHLSGCATQATFLNPGTHHATLTMTESGENGSDTRFFNVISDGKLHVKITNPQVGIDLRAGLMGGNTYTFTAVSTADLSGGANYVWTLTKVKENPAVALMPRTLTGQSISFTTDEFAHHEDCAQPAQGGLLRISVSASDQLGNVDDDEIIAWVDEGCPTK